MCHWNTCRPAFTGTDICFPGRRQFWQLHAYLSSRISHFTRTENLCGLRTRKYRFWHELKSCTFIAWRFSSVRAVYGLRCQPGLPVCLPACLINYLDWPHTFLCWISVLIKGLKRFWHFHIYISIMHFETHTVSGLVNCLCVCIEARWKCHVHASRNITISRNLNQNQFSPCHHHIGRSTFDRHLFYGLAPLAAYAVHVVHADRRRLWRVLFACSCVCGGGDVDDWLYTQKVNEHSKKWTNKVHQYLMLPWRRKVAKHSITSDEGDIVLLINRRSHTRKRTTLFCSVLGGCKWFVVAAECPLWNCNVYDVCWQIKRKKEETLHPITCFEHLAVKYCASDRTQTDADETTGLITAATVGRSISLWTLHRTIKCVVYWKMRKINETQCDGSLPIGIAPTALGLMAVDVRSFGVREKKKMWSDKNEAYGNKSLVETSRLYRCSRVHYAMVVCIFPIDTHTSGVEELVCERRRDTLNYTWKRKHLPLLCVLSYVAYVCLCPFFSRRIIFCADFPEIERAIVGWVRRIKRVHLVADIETTSGAGRYNPLPEWMDGHNAWLKLTLDP